jgi:hypothetical protein
MNRVTFAWAWSVYPRLSSSPMVAAGMTSEREKARKDVETMLGADEGAGWGVLQQIRVSVGEPCDEGPVRDVACSRRNALMCRRNGSGGFVWQKVTHGVRGP